MESKYTVEPFKFNCVSDNDDGNDNGYNNDSCNEMIMTIIMHDNERNKNWQ